jgi:hypothetical protein
MTDENPLGPTHDEPATAPGEGAPQQTPSEAPVPGPFEVLPGILFAPSATFARLGSARWVHLLLPLLALGIISALASFTFIKRVDMEEFTRDQLRHNRFASKMSEAQMEEAIEKSKDTNPYTRSAITVALTPAWLLLVGLLYWGAFLAMGAELNYLKAMVVVAWAQVPYWIAGILACGVFFLKDPNELDPMNPVFSNVAFFLSREETPGWLMSLLGSVDLFALWVVVLYILGFSVLGRISKGKAAGIVLAIFVAKVLVKVAFAAVISI